MEFHSNTSPLKLIVARIVVGEVKDNKTRLLYQYFFRVEIFLQVSNGKVFIMVKIKMIELMTMANNGKSEELPRGGRYFV